MPVVELMWKWKLSSLLITSFLSEWGSQLEGEGMGNGHWRVNGVGKCDMIAGKHY